MKPAWIDRRHVTRNFDRVAQTYAQADFLVREIDRRMQDRLDYVRLAPDMLLDLGCARGGSLQGLKARYPAAHYVGLDASLPMLQGLAPIRKGWQRWLGLEALGRQASPSPLLADAAHLPLLSRSTDLVWSNLLLHWMDDPQKVLAESHRVLKEGGLLMFSTLGPDTLKELRNGFDDGRAHTQRFFDMHDLGDMLVGAGFSDPVMDMEMLTLTYEDLDRLLAELKAVGSGCAMMARAPGLSGRGLWARVRTAYERLRQNGKLPATFEVIYGHAWKVAPLKTGDGRSVIQFEALKKQAPR